MTRSRVPHTLVLLFGMMVLALLLTYVLPQGQFERVQNEAGRELVVAESYAPVEAPRLSPLRLFMALPEGFAAAQEIIFFVFIVGGAFGVLRATGSVDALIGALLRRLEGKPDLLITGGLFIFASGSATIGMAEEYIPFVPILVRLCIALGFDAVTAIGILCCGYGIGYGIAPINPFTVLIAQDVAGVQPTSGWGYRVAISVVFLAVGVQHVRSYARRVHADPSRSLVADVEPDPSLHAVEHPEINWVHRTILTITGLAIVLVVYGLSKLHWYIQEMGALFLGLTIVYAAISWLGARRGLPGLTVDRSAVEFCRGAGELATTALLIGFARSILVILEDGMVIDTIVQGISVPLEYAGASIAAVGMLVVQTVCNFFIPSGSGQAYVTMPIMAPLADLVGVTRQTAVLAYQFGDGFANILVPTNAVLIGILNIARIPYDRWLRFILPFMLKVWAAAAAALVLAVAIGYE